MSAPEAVRCWMSSGAVALWTSPPASNAHLFAEYRALPAAQYAALVAERDALREALIEAREYVEAFDTSVEGQFDALSTVKVDIPVSDYECQYAVNAACATLARIDTALGAERAT